MSTKPGGESSPEKEVLKCYSNMRFEAEDFSKISYFQDDSRYEAHWWPHASMSNFFLFYDLRIYSFFDTGNSERQRPIDFLTDISQRHKPFEQGDLEYSRRISFYDTVINKHRDIIRPEKLLEFERRLNKSKNVQRPSLLMAANELGIVSYSQPVLNWSLSLSESSSAPHQCWVEITSHDLSYPMADISLFLKPTEFQKILSVIQLYSAKGTPLVASLMLNTPAYQGVSETIFLDYHKAPDKPVSEVGLGFPAAILIFSLFPLTAEVGE